MTTAPVTSSRPLQALKKPNIRRQWFTLLLTLGLTPIPLFGTLGYENALVLTAPLSLLGAFVGVDVIRALRTTPASQLTRTGAPATVLAAAARLGLSEIAWLLAIAVAVMFGTLLLVNNCDPLGGLTFFLMGPACSVVLGWICGLWGGVLARRRAAQVTLALTPIALCLALSLWRLYADPVVFAFDPFWGYFAGPLYDEAVRVDDRYLWYRGYNALAATCALALFYLWTARASKQLAAAGSRGKKPITVVSTVPEPKAKRVRGLALAAHPWVTALALVSAAGACWFGLQPARHGFTATVESLSKALVGTRETEHFTLHFAANSETARDIEMIAAEHEFAWSELHTTLRRAPASKIHSFIFPSPELKRRLLGAGRTEVAPPWRGHIYLNHYKYPHAVLQHELAHAFSATVGDPVFGVSGYLDLRRGFRLNMAMVEGFATALAPRDSSGLDLHDQAAVLDTLGKRPALASIMGVGFWGQASRHAYTAAGSFCLWLLETRGVEPLVTLYHSGGDVPGTYGVALEALEREWLEYLRARPLDEHAVETQRERFRKPSIFKRPCAHYAANLKHEADLANARGDHDEGLVNLRSLCAVEPEQPGHRLLLADAQARIERYDDATSTLTAAAGLPELTATLRSVLDERRGDIALLQHDLEAAQQAYESALATPGLSEARTRSLQLRWYAARDPRIAARIIDYFALFVLAPNLPEYVTRRVYAAERIADNSEYRPLSSYLVGRLLLNARAADDAAAHFERALTPEADEYPLPSTEFVRAAHMALVEAYTRGRDYERATQHLTTLRGLPGSTSGQRFEYERWGRRIAFMAAYAPPEEDAGDRLADLPPPPVAGHAEPPAPRGTSQRDGTPTQLEPPPARAPEHADADAPADPPAQPPAAPLPQPALPPGSTPAPGTNAPTPR